MEAAELEAVKLFDTHCHLQTEPFNEDREEVLRVARETGVESLLVPAIDVASFPGTLALAAEHSSVYCALGIHPHSSQEWNAGVRERIEEEAGRNPKLRAIGEIGLDYYYDFSPKEVQQQAFREQIQLAKQLRKPIIIHTRESDDDVYRIVEEEYAGADADQPRGQFHCFSGTVEMMQKVVSLGFHVSFTGNITFKKSTLTEVVREAPLESILIETDSPYLAPVPFRGKRNTPVYLPKVAEKIAEIKNIDVPSVMQKTYANAVKLFLSSAAILAFLFLVTTGVQAQPGRSNPVGNRPPDSVLTGQARQNEELRKQQQQQIQREAEQRRQDSIAQAARDQQEALARIQEQARQDSAKAAQRIAEEEAERQKMMTPIAWKAIGIGGSIGIGNMALTENKRTLTPTAVLATTLQAGTQITRVIDFEVQYSRMIVHADLIPDSLYNVGLDAPSASIRQGQKYLPSNNFPQHEDLKITGLSFDLRFVINPRRAFKYYAGIGYSHLTMAHDQTYLTAVDTSVFDPTIHTYSNSFSRGAIKVLFGARYDIELGDKFIVTPFAEIAAYAAFQGENAKPPYILRPDEEQITMTLLNAGVTIYFGWFGVNRLQ